MSGGFPETLHFSFADAVNRFVDWLVLAYGDQLRGVSDGLLQLLVALENLLRATCLLYTSPSPRD